MRGMSLGLALIIVKNGASVKIYRQFSVKTMNGAKGETRTLTGYPTGT
jgi:hypothetical protein